MPQPGSSRGGPAANGKPSSSSSTLNGQRAPSLVDDQYDAEHHRHLRRADKKTKRRRRKDPLELEACEKMHQLEREHFDPSIFSVPDLNDPAGLISFTINPTRKAWVELKGYMIFPGEGERLFEDDEVAAAEQLVMDEPGRYWGFLTHDSDPVGCAKIMCIIGEHAHYEGGRDGDATLHICRPPGTLPRENEVTLFRDEHSLCPEVDKMTGAMGMLRPGRAEGLCDEFGALYLRVFGPIDSHHLRVGSIGNVWLVSSFAALSVYAERVRSRIKQRELAISGRYEVTLFHPTKKEWQRIVIDDRLPVDPSRALKYIDVTSKGELWPLLLEKAFATIWGSYEALSQGHPLLAFKTLTGCPTAWLCVLSRQKKSGRGGGEARWTCSRPVFDQIKSRPTCTKFVAGKWPDSGQEGAVARTTEGLIEMLKWLARGESIMCCYADDGSKKKVSSHGILNGFAYPLLRVESRLKGSQGKTFDLFHVRTPHGSGDVEWTGRWNGYGLNSDSSWAQNEDVWRAIWAIHPADQDDGTFWVQREDFEKEFSEIHICLSPTSAAERNAAAMSTDESVRVSAPADNRDEQSKRREKTLEEDAIAARATADAEAKLRESAEKEAREARKAKEKAEAAAKEAERLADQARSDSDRKAAEAAQRQAKETEERAKKEIEEMKQALKAAEDAKRASEARADEEARTAAEARAAFEAKAKKDAAQELRKQAAEKAEKEAKEAEEAMKAMETKRRAMDEAKAKAAEAEAAAKAAKAKAQAEAVEKAKREEQRAQEAIEAAAKAKAEREAAKKKADEDVEKARKDAEEATKKAVEEAEKRKQEHKKREEERAAARAAKEKAAAEQHAAKAIEEAKVKAAEAERKAREVEEQQERDAKQAAEAKAKAEAAEEAALQAAKEQRAKAKAIVKKEEEKQLAAEKAYREADVQAKAALNAQRENDDALSEYSYYTDEEDDEEKKIAAPPPAKTFATPPPAKKDATPPPAKKETPPSRRSDGFEDFFEEVGKPELKPHEGKKLTASKKGEDEYSYYSDEDENGEDTSKVGANWQKKATFDELPQSGSWHPKDVKEAHAAALGRQSAHKDKFRNVKPSAVNDGWVTINGYAYFPGQGEQVLAGKPAAEAQKLVLSQPDKYWGFLTVDKDPVKEPKVMCLIEDGHAVNVSGDGPATLHIYRWPGSLPTANQQKLFVDSHELCPVEDPMTGAIGLLRPGRAEGVGDEYGKAGIHLFAPAGVSTSHVKKGSLGNDWLLSSLTVLANFPDRVRARIKQKEVAPDGRYDVNLFHPVQDKWVDISVDDRFPVGSSRALKYCGITAIGELWPCVLEKALARLWVSDHAIKAGAKGGYDAIQESDHNSPLLALKALTGLPLLSLQKQGSAWVCKQPVISTEASKPALTKFVNANWPDDGAPGTHARQTAALLPTLSKLHDAGCVMAAFYPFDGVLRKKISANGIRKGLAYPLTLVARNVAGKKIDMIQLRLPYESDELEWKGKWNARSDDWKKNGEVWEEVWSIHPGDLDDGVFWMESDDFEKEFPEIHVAVSEDAQRGEFGGSAIASAASPAKPVAAKESDEYSYYSDEEN